MMLKMYTFVMCACCQPHSIRMRYESSQWWKYGLWSWLWQSVVMYTVPCNYMVS